MEVLMSLKVLLQVIKAYPILHSIVLETMTDEEWLEYATGLEAEERTDQCTQQWDVRMCSLQPISITELIDTVGAAIERRIDAEGTLAAVPKGDWKAYLLDIVSEHTNQQQGNQICSRDMDHLMGPVSRR
jgi:hypothetical protein